MQSSVVTYQSQLLSGLARKTKGDSHLDPRSLGLTLDDPHGYLRIEAARLGPEDVVISRAASTGYSGALRDDSYFTFVLQKTGRYDLQISGRDYGMSSGDLLAFRPNERRTRVVPGKTGIRDVTTLQVPIARMEELARALETSANRVFPDDANPLRGKYGQSLATILPLLGDGLLLRPNAPVPPRVAQEIRILIDDVLSEMIGRIIEHTSSRRIFPAFHRVRQAEDMMQAQSDDPLSIQDIAQALGISIRSLQLAFNEVHGGLSARDYLNRIRLEKARQRLLSANADCQVTSIALDSGFFHLGRFAQAYARAFGERPSETLARRRA